MEYAQTFRQQRFSYSLTCVAVMLAIFFLALTGTAQVTPPKPEAAWPEELKNYPGLLPAFGQLLEKMQHDVQFPQPRNQSHLLPMVPESSTLYAAFPNYGDASHQALAIFQRELQQNQALREWWQHGQWATDGPKWQDSLEKFYQLSQYLGDEIVVAGTEAGAAGHKDSDLLILAEVRKPGLKEFLQQMVKDLAAKSSPASIPPARILDLHELATASSSDKAATNKKDLRLDKQLVILVRPDFVVAALSIAALRVVNARLDQHGPDFSSTPFGQRLLQAYQGGTTILAAADMRNILDAIPQSDDKNHILRRTGFADMKYLVWDHKTVAGESTSEMELSFSAPRHGVASWLAAPGSLDSLDFVSPKAILAAALRLKKPAEIFDDVKDLSTASNPNAFVGIAQMEAGLKLSFKDDLLNLLGGEITVELDSLTPPDAIWKAILKVNHPDHLQATLSTLLKLANASPQQSEEDGVTYYNLRIPSPQKTIEISYAFVDGYLIIAPKQQTVADAVRLHRTGQSLAKSPAFLASLPLSRFSDISGLLYEDPAAFTAFTLRQISPEMSEMMKSLSQSAAQAPPIAVAIYGEESALREVSKSPGVNVGGVLIGAAIAIPNLLRARIAANESSAVATMRTLNTAQVAYASAYPRKGYAHNLASLGPDPRGSGTESADHADFIDATLGCTTDAWCTRSGYRFSISATCTKDPCKQFVAVGTPVSSGTGSRNFCSTSDAVIRAQTGPPLTSPVSVSECKAWEPLN